MEIEIPKETDFERINIIAKQVHDLHVNWRPDFYIKVEQPIQKQYLKELIKNKEIYVAKEKANIIGYITISKKEKKYHGLHYKKIITIEVLSVDKYHQNKGVGRQLMQYIIELGQKEQCTDIQLTVNEENVKARKFYEGLGMRVKNISYSMKI